MTTPTQIIAGAAAAYGVSTADILARKRGTTTVVMARHSAMTIVRVKCRLGVEETGEIFGRHHADISYAAQKIADQCATDLKFKATYEALLAGVIVPFHLPTARYTKTIQKTNALPITITRRRRTTVELGLDILSHHVRLGQIVPRDAIAAACGVSSPAIRHIELQALRKIRKKIRILFNLDHGQFAITNHRSL